MVREPNAAARSQAIDCPQRGFIRFLARVWRCNVFDEVIGVSQSIAR